MVSLVPPSKPLVVPFDLKEANSVVGSPRQLKKSRDFSWRQGRIEFPDTQHDLVLTPSMTHIERVHAREAFNFVHLPIDIEKQN